ncbi:MAG: molecular chaperone TorD family protein [Bacillota bacterium]
MTGLPREQFFDGVLMAKAAGLRAGIYALLAGIFGSLPDKSFVAKIKGQEFRYFLNLFSEINEKKFRAGADCLKSFLSGIEHRRDEDVLSELAVDWTRIARAPVNAELRAPYEGLYKNREAVPSCILEVKNFYRRAGLLPDQSVQESPDFLGIELDFMKQLCLREQAQWLSGDEGAAATVLTEERFIADHLGSWVGDYCLQAGKHAVTGFYRGCLLILEALVEAEKKFLQEQARKLR